MDKEEFKEKFKSGMDQFLESSKKAIHTAGSAVQDFSDKSVIRIEIQQKKAKKDEQIKKLGTVALEKFQNDAAATLTASEEAVVEIMEEIKKIDAEIAEREEKLKAEKAE